MLRELVGGLSRASTRRRSFGTVRSTGSPLRAARFGSAGLLGLASSTATARNARASMAKVMCRCQAVQLRT
ncbi:hypothetical protein CQW44_35380 [Streptomyces griseofuscus]|uniref:Uncharacterized protein n=1 Tax=Streptomyces griseofuscus TaxID=146922 RepID=A0A3R8S789_9ACTN|nr:hypothetical protein CQW44_35380 [Streptomyces griseofuscus]